MTQSEQPHFTNTRPTFITGNEIETLSDCSGSVNQSEQRMEIEIRRQKLNRRMSKRVEMHHPSFYGQEGKGGILEKLRNEDKALDRMIYGIMLNKKGR